MPVLCIHLSVPPSLQVLQTEPLPWWGVKMVVVGVRGVAQTWEAGSWLWSCVEMDINQDNGLDSLGLSWRALAQAET